jgi:hypothetical protein
MKDLEAGSSVSTLLRDGTEHIEKIYPEFGEFFLYPFTFRCQ